jgi:hypothetical protein
VRRLSDRVTETRFDGYLTVELVHKASADYWALVGAQPAPYAVWDGTGVTGFERTIGDAAGRAVQLFKERGGLEYLVVTTSSGLRMMGAAMAASTQVPFRFFDTRAEAFEHLRALGAW